MKAILMSQFGDADVLHFGETEEPVMGPNDLLVRIHATAINRADLLQRRGAYPPPPGASEILGLEMSGVVVQKGDHVSGWSIGDKVCGLLPGGGYAELAVIPSSLAMPIPEGMSYESAAAIPEVFMTAYLNLFWLARLKAEETVLIHAGASGVGTAAIQLVREYGAIPMVTAGSPEKLARCKALGAQSGWNYHDGSFANWVQSETNGRGVDIILDFVGEPYFADNLSSLAIDGRLILIGTMGGSIVKNLNLGQLLYRRLHVIGTALRSRSISDKSRIAHDLMAFTWQKFSSGQMSPIVDTVFDWSEVVQAHRYMESNQNVGKIVLRVNH